MYRKTVLEFKTTKYTKAPAEFENIYTSAKDKVWVCKTWLCSETRESACSGQSQQAGSWGYTCGVIWSSLRIPFMKMVTLRCGKQRAIHGPAVNVYLQTWHLCVPFSQGCHLKPRWYLWNWRGNCVTKATICISMYDQLKSWLPLNGWEQTTHSTKIYTDQQWLVGWCSMRRCWPLGGIVSTALSTTTTKWEQD